MQIVPDESTLKKTYLRTCFIWDPVSNWKSKYLVPDWHMYRLNRTTCRTCDSWRPFFERVNWTICDSLRSSRPRKSPNNSQTFQRRNGCFVKQGFSMSESICYSLMQLPTCKNPIPHFRFPIQRWLIWLVCLMAPIVLHNSFGCNHRRSAHRGQGGPGPPPQFFLMKA